MSRARGYSLAALILLALSLSGCGLGQEEKSEVNLPEIFPGELPAVGEVQRLDVNGDKDKEWLIFYHVDLVEGNAEGSPTTAAVYRPVANPDSRLPPQLIPALLWLPRRGYPCFYTCEAEMQDVISQGMAGEELIVRDKRGSDVVGVAIFRWQKDLVLELEDGSKSTVPGGFVPLGHFRADMISVEKDVVTVIRKQGDRSDLATREVYVPQNGYYYVDPATSMSDAKGQLRSPQEAEVIFALGPPEEPAKVKLPEKLVMTFYHSFGNLDEVEAFLAGRAKQKLLQGCPADTCGCASPWQNVSRAMVKQIAYEAEDKPDIAIVVRVLCIRKNGQADPLRTVTWQAQRREDGTWRLIDVFPGGDEHLISSLTVGQ